MTAFNERFECHEAWEWLIRLANIEVEWEAGEVRVDGVSVDHDVYRSVAAGEDGGCCTTGWMLVVCVLIQGGGRSDHGCPDCDEGAEDEWVRYRREVELDLYKEMLLAGHLTGIGRPGITDVKMNRNSKLKTTSFNTEVLKHERREP